MSYLTHPHIYQLLKQQGHTPDKAAEITLDAGRGDEHSRLWIRTLSRARR